MAPYLKAQLDAGKMRKVGRQLAAEARRAGGGRGPIGAALRAAGGAYMGFIRERYVDYSRGGGNWPPLAPSTIRSRRKGKGKQARQTAAIFQAQGMPAGAASILIDTGTLLGSITPGQHKTEDIPAGVRVGTEVEYAKYHQRGQGVPQREIFVQPNQRTVDRIHDILERGYQQSVNRRSNAS